MGKSAEQKRLDADAFRLAHQNKSKSKEGKKRAITKEKEVPAMTQKRYGGH